MEKEGRTLLIMKEQNSIKLDNVAKDFLSKSKSRFVEFNSLQDSKAAFDKCSSDNIKCKYAYYNSFIRLKNIKPDTDEEELKNNIIDKLKEQVNDVNLIDIKLFKKNDKLINSGYVIFDKLDDLNNIITKQKIELPNNQNILFYKFIKKQ